MEHHISIRLSLVFQSKWHTGSGESNLMTDRLLARDARGRPFIPASTFKGIARESCEKLSRTLGYDEPADPHQTDLRIQDTFFPLNKLKSPIDRIFGSRYQSGNLFFRDVRLEERPPYGWHSTRNRIAMHRRLGTAKDRHLFSTEYAAPLAFTTAIEGHHNDLVSIDEIEKTEPPYAYCLLIAGLMNIEKIGGDKSTGSGAVSFEFQKIEYNGQEIQPESIFEYLDAELYKLTKEEAAQ